MELTAFVESHRAAFGSSIKLVEDIVRFLQLTCFRELPSYGQFDQYRFVMLYREWFYELCAVCWKLGVPLPTLKSEIATWRSDSVDRSLTTPDYRTLAVRDAVSEIGSKVPVRVLIVDDMPADISKTFRALRGWPNLVLDALHIRLHEDGTDEALYQHATQEIIARNPQIVLMDYGLPLTATGDMIIYAVRAKEPKTNIAFVANTGGDPAPLNVAGAYGNFDKGKELWVMRQVLKNLA